MDHILSIVLFTPLAGLLVLLFLPSSNPRLIKIWANIAAFIGFLVSLPLVFQFDRCRLQQLWLGSDDIDGFWTGLRPQDFARQYRPVTACGQRVELPRCHLQHASRQQSILYRPRHDNGHRHERLFKPGQGGRLAGGSPLSGSEYLLEAHSGPASDYGRRIHHDQFFT